MTTTKQPQFSVKAEGDAFTLYRDDEALRTPRNLQVTAPTRRLAEALAQECGGQGEKMDLRKMPLTQMTLTAIDISAMHREEVITGIMRFGESELICQRATDPADLVEEQNKIWQPYLDWCKTKFNADLRTGSGIIPFKQAPEALAALRAFVEKLDAFSLTGLSEAVGISGSLVLGLALATGYADVASIVAAAELDNLWQSKKWGEDPAVQNRQNEITQELEICARFFALLS
ncbi:MAG: ATP12 family protein [Alphaproteobacteria bacterium]|nr:ATP12 family protein [Alphaproteobacteria bacterium]